ncbi:unnamed protein product [Ectocarpus sp. 4 AP-2014]
MAGSGLLRLLFLFTRDELHTRAGPTCRWRQSKGVISGFPNQRVHGFHLVRSRLLSGYRMMSSLR